MIRTFAILAVLAVALIPGEATATQLCLGDAPMLPGALSGQYDMWNNIWRHYTCGPLKLFEDADILVLA